MSPSLLTKRLRRLERAGVVERREGGNRVEYVLTGAGEELGPIIEALGQWGTRWIPELADEDPSDGVDVAAERSAHAHPRLAR